MSSPRDPSSEQTPSAAPPRDRAGELSSEPSIEPSIEPSVEPSPEGRLLSSDSFVAVPRSDPDATLPPTVGLTGLGGPDETDNSDAADNAADAADAAPPSIAAGQPSSGSTYEPARRQRIVDLPSTAAPFGDYELLQEVARGGMGVVFKARHTKLNRIAAIKMILGGRFSSADERRRFYTEAESAAALDHPGIVPVYEIGEQDGQPFFAMKFVDGTSLAERQAEFRADPRKAVAMLAVVARAVQHAHQHGILHRDLKPANVLIDADGQPLLTDLGLAKSVSDESNLTRTGAVLGTPNYMSPEQAGSRDRVTTRSDIFALGAMLYELLCGRTPHVGETPIQTVMGVLNDPIVPPRQRDRTIDPDLELICLKCLQRDPDERYDSARDLADDLDRWLAEEPISLKPPSRWAVAGRWLRQHQSLVYFAFALLLGLVLSLPLFISVFQTAGNQSMTSVYEEYFPNATPPWFLSLTNLPEWVPRLAFGLLLFVFWPLIGLWNAIVTRPRSHRGALAAGLLTATVCAGIVFLAFGWLLIALDSGIQTRKAITALGDAVWLPPGATQDLADRRAETLFQDLDKVPVAKRSAVLADRVFNEQLRLGLHTVGRLLTILLWFTIPIVAGTVVAHSLLARRLPAWLVLVRYAVAIVAVLTLVGVAMAWLYLEDSFLYRPLFLGLSLAAAVAIWLALRHWSAERQQRDAASNADAESYAPTLPLGVSGLADAADESIVVAATEAPTLDPDEPREPDEPAP